MKSSTPKSKVQGEGDYASARKYDQAVGDFVKSGKVEKAARDAAPHNPQEQDAMLKAEAQGRSHSKGEDKGNAGQNGDWSGQSRPEKRAPGKHPHGKPVPEKARGR